MNEPRGDRPWSRNRPDSSEEPAHETLVEPGGSQLRLVCAAIAAFGAVVASNLASLGVDHLHTSLINANWQFSWSHDVDTLLLGVGVYASLVGARASRSTQRLWIATAAILGLFFLDELSPLHGKIGNLDKLLYAPLLVALVVCVLKLTAGTRDRVVMLWALATLLFAFGMHVVGLHLLRPIGYTTYLYQAGVGLKEGTELAGVIMLVSTLWRRARAEHIRKG